jgi:hypothetical protein
VHNRLSAHLQKQVAVHPPLETFSRLQKALTRQLPLLPSKCRLPTHIEHEVWVLSTPAAKTLYYGVVTCPEALRLRTDQPMQIFISGSQYISIATRLILYPWC